MIIKKESLKRTKNERNDKIIVNSNLRGSSAYVGGGINA